jgi:hypothetical protein
MAKPKFINLWNSYPTEKSPCDGPYNNQCAIRMSVCLNGEGTITVNKKTYSEPTCKHGHARGAESLANWLSHRNRLGAPKKYHDAKAAKVTISGKKGLIFFKDCFTRDGEITARGDHIDLWDGYDTIGFSDDQNVSKQIWFWEL